MNLEQLIRDHAEQMAPRMQSIAQTAGSEEDVRQAVNALLNDFISKAGLTISVRNEYSLRGGRVDSKYGGVIIEYKDPRGSGKITESPDAPGTKAVVKQLADRFRDFQKAENIPPDHIFGVGCDGDTLVFVRGHKSKVEAEAPVPVTAHTVERLLRALVSIGAQGPSFTPENLALAFGSGSGLAQDGVRALYEVITQTDSPKAKTFFRQWKILFGEVCGYDVEGKNVKVQKLAEHYGIKGGRSAELLFAVHSYYAIFMKFLAAELVGSMNPMVISELRGAVGAHSSEALRREMDKLEKGGIWTHMGITNFLEGDLFSWYLAAWDERIFRAVSEIARKLDDFDPRTLSVEPNESRDLLKKLYQNLFPKSVRHDLGEYYTPDWLAELTLNELGYDGDPDKRLLDPACGSGTFLVMALNRAKQWFDDHRHECGYGERELAQKLLANIIGFDLNPLAVMASRTNYLLALRDLLPYAQGAELPVYLCDSIMTPADYGGLFAAGGADRRELLTAAARFQIPAEVTTSREAVNRYAAALEFCVQNRYDPGAFLEYSRQQGVDIDPAHEMMHRALFEELRRLDEANENGIWARIIKNAFAPIFIGKVDYVAGNPPWVNWESLPEQYRNDMKRLWQKYGLFSLSGAEGRLGGGKKDLSMLFVYASVDHYLNYGGRLGFVITQSVFKTQGAGDGFRQFRFLPPDGPAAVLQPTVVHDLSAMQVFEGATNRTAVFVCEKQAANLAYPVPYQMWHGPGRIAQEETLEGVSGLVTRQQMAALPISPKSSTSPWLTAAPEALPGILKVIGKSGYKAYEGVNTGGLNGCYWVRVLERLPNGDFLIENLHDVGKIKVERVRVAIEPELVYPLLRGRDVLRWQAEPSAHVILAQDPSKGIGIPERSMQLTLPKTFAYLKHFEGDSAKPDRGTLRGRALYRKYFSQSDPFYTMYNTSVSTLAEWKVMWPEVGHTVRAGVCGPKAVDKEKPSLPDHTIVAVSCSDALSAYYLCGLMNSAPAQAAVSSYVVLHPSPHVLEHVAIPKYSSQDPLHQRLAELAMACHEATARGDAETVRTHEAEIDRLAAQLWGITDAELRAIRAALSSPGQAGADEEDDED